MSIIFLPFLYRSDPPPTPACRKCGCEWPLGYPSKSLLEKAWFFWGSIPVVIVVIVWVMIIIFSWLLPYPPGSHTTLLAVLQGQWEWLKALRIY